MVDSLTRKSLKFAKQVIVLAVFGFVLFFYASNVQAAFSPYLSYQGKLTDSGGNAVADGSYNLKFQLCPDSGCSSVLWTETYINTDKVTVTSGLFSVNLGQLTSLNGIDFNQSLYLEISVGGTGVPSWEVLTPRKFLGAVPNSFNTQKFDGLATTSFLRADLANTRATITNLTSTNFYADNSSGTNATSTNLFASVFNALSVIITNLTATIANITTLVFGTATGNSLSVTDLNVTSTANIKTLNASTTISTSVSSTNATSTNFYSSNVTITGGSVATSAISGLVVANFASPNVSQWTNNAGYLTSYVESDPVFMAASTSLAYQPVGSYLTVESDPVWLAASSSYLTTASATAIYLTQASSTATYLTQASSTATYMTIASTTATYLAQATAASTYLTQATAASTYLTQASSTATYMTIASTTATYLAQATAASTYLTQATAASTYLTQATAGTNYLALSNWFSTTTLPASVISSSLAQVGTITSGTWNGTAIQDAYIADNITASNYLSLATWYATTSAPQFTTLAGLTSIGGSGATTTFGGNISIAGNASFTLATIDGLSGNIITSNNIKTAITDLDTRLYNQQNTTKEMTGFPNRTDSSIAFDDGTRTFTITGTNFKIYSAGKEYTKNTESITIPNVLGLYFVYYDKTTGNLSTSTTAWGLTDGTVQVATIYWNGTNSLLGEERHGLTMDGQTHEYLHSTVGTRYNSGFTGTFSSPPTFSVTGGSIYDEDISNSTTTTQTLTRILYRSGSDYTFTAPTSSYYYQLANIIQYDNAGTIGNVTNNNYVAYWVFATNDPITPIYVLMGQRQDTTLANARANNTYESLSLTNLPFKEMKVLYRVIILCSGTSEVYQETQDLRSVSNLSSGTYVATAHGILTGLLNDDHTQYLLLAGRGGQTITDDISVGSASTPYALTVYGTSTLATTTITVMTASQYASTTQLFVSSSSTLGTVISGTWNGAAIGATYGGTGQTSVSAGDLLYGSGANAWGKLSGPGAASYVLRSSGANAFAWGALQAGDLPSDGYAATYVNVSGDTMSGALVVNHNLSVAGTSTLATTTVSGNLSVAGNATTTGYSSLATTSLAYDSWIGSNLGVTSTQFKNYAINDGSVFTGYNFNMIEGHNGIPGVAFNDNVIAYGIDDMPNLIMGSANSPNYAIMNYNTSTDILSLSKLDSEGNTNGFSRITFNSQYLAIQSDANPILYFNTIAEGGNNASLVFNTSTDALNFMGSSGGYYFDNSILPSTTLSYNLGSSGYRWDSLWTKTLNIGTSTWSIGPASNGSLTFYSGASQGGSARLTIATSTGYLGIGTSTPESSLDVVGTSTLRVGATYWKTSKVTLNGIGDFPLLTGLGASTTDSSVTYSLGMIESGLNLLDNSNSGSVDLNFLQVDSGGNITNNSNITANFENNYFTASLSFNPDTDNSYNLGSGSLRWNNLYLSGNASLASLNSNGAVYSNNGVLTNVNPSSREYKNSISSTTLNIDALLGLQVKSFNWNNSGQADFGLIAEEIRDALPELYADNGTTKGYRADHLPFYLLQIAQRQESQIEFLSKMITDLAATTSLDVISNPVSSDSFDNLKVVSAAAFYGTITVIGEAGFESRVTFKNDVEIEGKLYLDKDQVGTAVIKAGSTTVQVVFEKPFRIAPKVLLNLDLSTSSIFAKYAVSNKSTSSFTIVIDQTVIEDLYFDWVAFGQRNEAGYTGESSSNYFEDLIETQIIDNSSSTTALDVGNSSTTASSTAITATAAATELSNSEQTAATVESVAVTEANTNQPDSQSATDLGNGLEAVADPAVEPAPASQSVTVSEPTASGVSSGSADPVE